VSKTILALACSFLLSLPFGADALPWSVKSFEECMSRDMKDRPKEQLRVVESDCRKRFPALPKFVNKAHNGLLHCHGTEYPDGFTVWIRDNTVTFGKLPFEIIQRTSEGLRAKTTPEADTGTLKGGFVLSVNFEFAQARLIPVDKPSQVVALECKEFTR